MYGVSGRGICPLSQPHVAPIVHSSRRHRPIAFHIDLSPASQGVFYLTTMAPKRSKRVRRARNGIDRIHFPLTYNFTEAGASVTTIETLSQTFDRRRAFRVAGFRGEIAAYKYPITVQFEVYGPQNTSDNVYATPAMVVPTGTVRKFARRLPASATGWFPSESALTTRICQLVNICTSKNVMGGLVGAVTLLIDLRPFELPDTCPTVQEFVPLFHSDDDDESPSSSRFALVPTPEV